jgi:cytochrome b561
MKIPGSTIEAGSSTAHSGGIKRGLSPVAGWIATSAYRVPVTVFGLFELPPTWPNNRVSSEQLFFIRSVIGIALALSGVQQSAKVRHAFVSVANVV